MTTTLTLSWSYFVSDTFARNSQERWMTFGKVFKFYNKQQCLLIHRNCFANQTSFMFLFSDFCLLRNFLTFACHSKIVSNFACYLFTHSSDRENKKKILLTLPTTFDWMSTRSPKNSSRAAKLDCTFRWWDLVFVCCFFLLSVRR